MLTDVLYTVIDPRDACLMALVEPSLAIPGLEGPAAVAAGKPLGQPEGGSAVCWRRRCRGGHFGAVGLTPYPAQSQNPVATLKAPSFAHLSGRTSSAGHVSLVLQGLYVSLKISCVAVAIAVSSGPWAA